MNRIDIICDTSHDLDRNYIVENNIETVSFYLSLDGENYLEDQVDISREELYKILREDPDVYPKTSLPSVDAYLSKFRRSLENGRDIICITVAGSLSGSFQSAKLAKDLILEERSGARIHLIDSRSASLGTGYLVSRAVELRGRGLDSKSIAAILKDTSRTSQVYISLDTLSYLEKGGRMSKTGVRAANFLNIKPVVSFIDSNLKLEGLYRGRRRALDKILDLLDKRIGDRPEDYEVFLVHGDEGREAELLSLEIEKRYKFKMKFKPALVSAAIISHIGPGALAIISIKKIQE